MPRVTENEPIAGGIPASSKDTSYDYILSYLYEAIEAREPIIELTERAIRAFRGFPSVNRYVGRIETLSKSYMGDDSDRAKALADACKTITPRKSYVVKRAINTMVAQAMGGIEQYECEVFDPYFQKDDTIVDLINAAAKHAYMDNNVDSMIPQGIEFAALSGSVYTLIEKKKESDKELDLTWIPATEMLLDPIRLKRNKERFIGHQTSGSWRDIKRNIKKKKDGYILQSINETDTYLDEIGNVVTAGKGNFKARELKNSYLAGDLNMFYSMSILDWAQSSVTTEGKVFSKYEADDVEISYIYDLINRVRLTVINRRFIIRAEKNYLTGDIEYTHPIIDGVNGAVSEAYDKVKISLDHPYVALENKRSLWQNYAYTELNDLLDDFDDICALETLIAHTINIMTPITFTGNPSDVEKLSQISGVSGELIKGFVANSITVLNKAIDLTPALSYIQRLEANIKWILNGPDPKEQSEMLGDRASGTEAALASSTATQGLAPFLSNLESWAGDLATKMFRFMAIYNDGDWEYKFPVKSSIATLSRENLAGQMKFRAILRNRIKVEARQSAQTTLQWFVPLVQSEYVINKDKMARDVIPLIAEAFTRGQVKSWFEKDEATQQREQAQYEYILKQNQKAKEEEAFKNLDLSMVNPYGANNQFNAADISAALSPYEYSDDPDYEMEYEGGQKPMPTSRKLGYGIGNVLPYATGVDDLKNNQVDKVTGYESVEDLQSTAYDPDGFLGDQKSTLLQDPVSGGIGANDPVTGITGVL